MLALRFLLWVRSGPPIEFLSAKRAQNIAIGLKTVQSLPFARIAAEVQLLNPHGLLGREDAAALLKILPTEEEAVAARELRRQLAATGACVALGCTSDSTHALEVPASMREGERFVLHVLEVPAYERKLEVIALLASFEQSVASVGAAVYVLQSAASRVLSSDALRTSLGLILRLGNALNRGTPRGHAAGFDVSVLPTLAAVKSTTDTSISLLHHVAAILQDPNREDSLARPGGKWNASAPARASTVQMAAAGKVAEAETKVEVELKAEVEVSVKVKASASAEATTRSDAAGEGQPRSCGGTFDAAFDAAADEEMQQAALSSLVRSDAPWSAFMPPSGAGLRSRSASTSSALSSASFHTAFESAASGSENSESSAVYGKDHDTDHSTDHSTDHGMVQGGTSSGDGADSGGGADSGDSSGDDGGSGDRARSGVAAEKTDLDPAAATKASDDDSGTGSNGGSGTPGSSKSSPASAACASTDEATNLSNVVADMTGDVVNQGTPALRVRNGCTAEAKAKVEAEAAAEVEGRTKPEANAENDPTEPQAKDDAAEVDATSEEVARAPRADELFREAPDLVVELRNELGDVPSINEATDLLASVEGQISSLAAELTKVRTELALLPHPPAPPAMLPGYPFMQPIADDKLMMLFATEEASTVRWVLQPRWRKPPSFSSWGKPMPPPRPADVLAGQLRTGAPAIASGTLVLRAADEPRLVLLEHLPRGAELMLFAVVVDAFGWASGRDDEGSDGGGSSSEGGDAKAGANTIAAEGERARAESNSAEARRAPRTTPWQRMATERIGCGSEAALLIASAVSSDEGWNVAISGGGGGRMAGNKENSLADDPSATVGDADDADDAATSGADTDSSVFGRAVCASHPPITTLGKVPPLPPDDATAEELRSHAECRASLRVLNDAVLRSRLLVTVRLTRSQPGGGVSSGGNGGSVSSTICRGGRVVAMTTRAHVSVNDVLMSGNPHSPYPLPQRPPSARSSPLRSSPHRRFSIGGGSGTAPSPAAPPSPAEPETEPPMSSFSSAEVAEDEPPPLKAPVEGLYTRFLLSSFLTVAAAELGELRRRRDALLDTLSQCAMYLGLGRAAQSNVGDQLGALSVLRDFALLLAKCSAENEARARLDRQRQLDEAMRQPRVHTREMSSTCLGVNCRDSTADSGREDAHEEEAPVNATPVTEGVRSCSAPKTPTLPLPEPLPASVATPVEPSPARAYDELDYF